MEVTIPDFVTHYYAEQPFRTLTELTEEACQAALASMGPPETLPRRLRSEFYFQERRRYEERMREQFLAKGGRPQRKVPHYAILGESEIWAKIRPSALRIPLENLPADAISFTYTDSFANYVGRDLDGDVIPRKPQYETLYRLDELPYLFQRWGWPGDRWKTEPDWAHDLYVEVQLWDDEPLRPFIAAAGFS